MGQRVRATVNVRLVVTSDGDDASDVVQAVANSACTLDEIVKLDVKNELVSVVEYFDHATVDLFEVDVHHSVVNVNEVPAA